VVSLSEYISFLGIGCLGATIGLISGINIARRMGLTPSAKELEKALNANENYYKSMVARFRGRLKEYEQPSELQQFASKFQGENPENLVQLLANELPNVRGIPRYLRPFLPAISNYMKENPEQVQALITKFASSVGTHGKGEGQGEGI